MTKARKLGELARLAQMQREAELARLSALMAQRQKLVKQVEDLDIARRSARKFLADSPQPGGVGGRFETFALERKARLFEEITSLAPVVGEARKQAARALGRHSVLEQLAEQAYAKRRR